MNFNQEILETLFAANDSPKGLDYDKKKEKDNKNYDTKLQKENIKIKSIAASIGKVKYFNPCAKKNKRI